MFAWVLLCLHLQWCLASLSYIVPSTKSYVNCLYHVYIRIVYDVNCLHYQRRQAQIFQDLFPWPLKLGSFFYSDSALTRSCPDWRSILARLPRLLPLHGEVHGERDGELLVVDGEHVHDVGHHLDRGRPVHHRSLQLLVPDGQAVAGNAALETERNAQVSSHFTN